MKNLIAFLLAVLCFFAAFRLAAQTRDSIACKDSTYFIPAVTQVCTTYKVPIITPDELLGMYSHPDYVTIGSKTSENKLLSYVKKKGGNMVNNYARSFMDTKSERALFASYCRNGRDNYGIKLMTNDIRHDYEAVNWSAFYAEHPDLIGFVEPLTEKEPWLSYDYSGCFRMLRAIYNVKLKYPGVKVNFYEGWMGKGYSNPQSAVDSMVLMCDRIFISNYVIVSQFNSSDPGYGEWDNRMDVRCYNGSSSVGGITKACKKFGKVMPIVEIESLERDFLFYLYDCRTPSATCSTFYGSVYGRVKTDYNKSNAEVLQYTDLVGQTLFYIKYIWEAQPN
jgi:hypothetical protein